jgi:hypothetical protein
MSTHYHYNDNCDNRNLEIKPSVSLLDLNLKEVWRYRDLMMFFFARIFDQVHTFLSKTEVFLSVEVKYFSTVFDTVLVNCYKGS